LSCIRRRGGGVGLHVIPGGRPEPGVGVALGVAVGVTMGVGFVVGDEVPEPQ
jgi:hypothetical protein